MFHTCALFVCQNAEVRIAKEESTVYIQVAATVRDENTLQRALRPLQRINDNYPKLILTLDDDPNADYAGIRRINALEWLIGKA